jgi:hypothetical protein
MNLTMKKALSLLGGLVIFLEITLHAILYNDKISSGVDSLLKSILLALHRFGINWMGERNQSSDE